MESLTGMSAACQSEADGFVCLLDRLTWDLPKDPGLSLKKNTEHLE